MRTSQGRICVPEGMLPYRWSWGTVYVCQERIAASRVLQDSMQVALNNAQLLGKSQESRAYAAENTLEMTRMQAEETKQTLEKTHAQVVKMSDELKRLQDAAQAAETSFAVQREGRSKELEDTIAELQTKNSRLAADAEAILLRYRDGRLVSILCLKMNDLRLSFFLDR